MFLSLRFVSLIHFCSMKLKFEILCFIKVGEFLFRFFSRFVTKHITYSENSRDICWLYIGPNHPITNPNDKRLPLIYIG
jgi:hypothetical protein